MPYLDQLDLGNARAHRPEINRIPTALNYAARDYWALAVQKVRAQKPTASPYEQWKLAVLLFAQHCKASGVPIRSSKVNSNVQVVTHLHQERKRIVKFLQDTKLLLNCKVRTGVRTVKIRNGAFVLTVDAKIKFNRNVDNIVYKHFRFKRRMKAYASELSRYTTVRVYNESAAMDNRWHLSYEIACPVLPFLKSKPLLEREELERLLFRIWDKVALYVRPSLHTVDRGTRLHTI